MGEQNYILIIVGLLLGGGAAAYAARVVKMTAMPQMTAIYNGMGGATAALVSLGEFIARDQHRHRREGRDRARLHHRLDLVHRSMVAFLKLQELIPGKPIRIAESADVQPRGRRRDWSC